MSTNKTRQYIGIASAIALIIGIILIFFSGNDLSSDLKTRILIGVLISLPVFIILEVLNKTINFFEIRNTAKPYVVAAYASWLLSAIVFMIFCFNDVKEILQEMKMILCMLGFSFFLSSMYLQLFLMNLSDTKEKSFSFDDYVLYRRDPVTLDNPKTPEMYFENDKCKSIYLTNAESISHIAEEKVKDFIFENKLQNEIPREYYVSRVDFFMDGGFSPTLSYMMVFIEKKIIKYSMYGFTYSTRVKETDYCLMICRFDYHQSNIENQFTLHDIDERNA